MKKAWKKRKAAAKRFNCKVSDVPFGECLRLAWRDYKCYNKAITLYAATSHIDENLKIAVSLAANGKVNELSDHQAELILNFEL